MRPRPSILQPTVGCDSSHNITRQIDHQTVTLSRSNSTQVTTEDPSLRVLASKPDGYVKKGVEHASHLPSPAGCLGNSTQKKEKQKIGTLFARVECKADGGNWRYGGGKQAVRDTSAAVSVPTDVHCHVSYLFFLLSCSSFLHSSALHLATSTCAFCCNHGGCGINLGAPCAPCIPLYSIVGRNI